MKTPPRRNPKTASAKQAKAKKPALFLGTKVLGELRILLRLAASNQQQDSAESRRAA